MAYNPYEAVKAIYNFKGQWDAANKSGDTTKKNNVARYAQDFYKQLRNNGYGNLADELDAVDYSGAKAIHDKWAKTGRTSTRDYLYSLGKSYGMTSSDVDKIISWDNQTGEVSLGGKKVGKPDAIVDGVSYWGDTAVLDNAFKDYITRSGITLSNANASAKNATGVNNKINELWGMRTGDHDTIVNKYLEEYDYLKNTNPFTTDEAKAILGKYDLSALQGRDNAVANGASSNGGNIDSYAAANAMRQQAALINQGQMAVLSAHQQKLDHAKSLLEGMGVQMINDSTDMQNIIGLQQNESQRLFENDQTAINNDVARKKTISEITGVVPDEWVASNNPYINDDGTIKEQFKNTDFSEVMEQAKKAGNTNLYNYAAMARFYKIMGDYDAYGKYDDGNYMIQGERKTLPSEQFNKTMDYNYAVLKSNETMNADNNATEVKINADDNKTALDAAKIEAQNNIDVANLKGTTSDLTVADAEKALKNGEITEDILALYNSKWNTSYTKDNPPPIYKPAKTNDETMDWTDDESDSAEVDYEAKLNTVYNKSSKTVKDYIRNKLKPLITENSITEEELRNHLTNNSKEYDLEVNDIKAICEALDVDSMWVDNYKNKGLFSWGSGVKEK